MFKHIQLLIIIVLLTGMTACAQHELALVKSEDLTNGADRIPDYLPLLTGKRIALLANQASKVSNVSLADTLLSLNIPIELIFTPEHGFRGLADAGAPVNDTLDELTGVKLISLYGKNKRPTVKQLEHIDVVVCDLQDVGVRFYTYISTLTYMIESCGAAGVHVIILDRPNPNGFLVDGPLLEAGFESFVGLHQIPIAHGMTPGEYMKMAIGEGWIESPPKLTVISMKGYNHNMIVDLQVKPSPNLPCWESVYLYPSLCFFEGTNVSVGRGTEHPFECYGSPYLQLGSFAFTPVSMPGMSKYPPYEGIICYGQNLNGYAHNYRHNEAKINLAWLLSAYEQTPDSIKFFNNYFDKLAGNFSLREAILDGFSEEDIRSTWETGLNNFKAIREKYLLYP